MWEEVWTAGMEPETRYARSEDLHIAYQVVGQGSSDLVLVPPFVSHVELYWEEPLVARFLTRLASFSRLILFDKRGTGLSDRVPPDRLPTLEQRMDDVRAVMDAAGSERAALFGPSEGGPMSALFAATYPERTSALILYGTLASTIRDASYPWPMDPAERRTVIEAIPKHWGRGTSVDLLAPQPRHRRALPALVGPAGTPGGKPGRGDGVAPDEWADRHPRHPPGDPGAHIGAAPDR
jgi:pimeloyl-ACP methyl ester carboxylesterase